MEKTKKYTIIFVVLCFIGIGAVSVYNAKKNNPVYVPIPTETKDTNENNSIIHTSVVITGLDGIIVQGNIEIENGKSVYDVLKKLCEQNDIKISTNGFGQIIYVTEIDGLKEFDHGVESGWKYKVNEVYPSLGAGNYKVKDGDQIEWIYKTVK